MKYKNFGEYLCKLRLQKEYTYEELKQKINKPEVTVKTIKQWEKNLKYPDLNIIYILSEIYMVPSETFLQIKEETLKKGENGILVKWLSYTLGISVYGAIWLSRIIIYGALILVFLWFYFVTKP